MCTRVHFDSSLACSQLAGVTSAALAVPAMLAAAHYAPDLQNLYTHAMCPPPLPPSHSQDPSHAAGTPLDTQHLQALYTGPHNKRGRRAQATAGVAQPPQAPHVTPAPPTQQQEASAARTSTVRLERKERDEGGSLLAVAGVAAAARGLHAEGLPPSAGECAPPDTGRHPCTGPSTGDAGGALSLWVLASGDQHNLDDDIPAAQGLGAGAKGVQEGGNFPGEGLGLASQQAARPPRLSLWEGDGEERGTSAPCWRGLGDLGNGSPLEAAEGAQQQQQQQGLTCYPSSSPISGKGANRENAMTQVGSWSMCVVLLLHKMRASGVQMHDCVVMHRTRAYGVQMHDWCSSSAQIVHCSVHAKASSF